MQSNISNPTSSGFNGSIKFGVGRCNPFLYCDILVPDTIISVCLSPNNPSELFPVLKIAKPQFPMESDIRSLNCKYFGWRFLCKLCRRMNWKRLSWARYSDECTLSINVYCQKESKSRISKVYEVLFHTPDWSNIASSTHYSFFCLLILFIQCAI